MEQRLNEINVRLAEIRSLIDEDGADFEALNTEADALIAERKAIQEKAEKRKKLLQSIVDGSEPLTRKQFFPDNDAHGPEKREYNAGSPEYRSAFLKNLVNQDLTKEERAAFVHTTETTPNVLPTQMLNEIWDLISEEHSIMGDITKYVTGTVIQVTKHTAIKQGDAKGVGENSANDDEQNEFVSVTLSGKDFSKSIDITYAMEKMSIAALETYLVKEISDRLGSAMAKDVVAQINKDMNSENVVPVSGELTFKDVASAFGKLKKVAKVTVYATRNTIYNHLIGMVDSNNRPIFQPSAQAGAEGSILGALIKVDDAVADGSILLGDSKKVVYNMVQDIIIESDKDIKKHVKTYSGYARGEGALINPDAFARLDISGE